MYKFLVYIKGSQGKEIEELHTECALITYLTDRWLYI